MIDLKNYIFAFGEKEDVDKCLSLMEDFLTAIKERANHL